MIDFYKLFSKGNRFKLLSFFLLCSACTILNSQGQTTVTPVRYWTFNGASATTDSTNHSALDFSYYGSQYTVSTGKVGKCINLGATGNLTLGGAVTADSSLTVEFLFKPGPLFNSTKFFSRGDNAVNIGFSYPYINFNTKHTTFAGAVITDNWTITLDGVSRKTYGYYTDGNWHHMVFKFNANTGTKEVWVDGALATGFSKTLTAGYITNPAGSTVFSMNSTVSYSKYFGAIDEIAVYNTNLPSALIYKHYLDFYNNSLPYSYQNNYVGTIPAASAPTAGIDINEYAPGHPTPTVTALAQLQSSPMPRYVPSNTLKKNFNWVEPGYFGGNYQTGVSTAQAVTNSVNLQKEMVFNYNYSWIVMSNTGSYTNLNSASTFESNWIATANQYPQYPASCLTYWAQLRPSNAGYVSTSSYINAQNKPANQYLRNSAGQFINPSGAVSATKYWSPAGPTDSIVKDGLTQKYYIQQLLNKLTRPLDFINEDGEVLPQVDTTVLKLDPTVVADKNASGLDWMTYYGNRCKNVTQVYRNQFMNGLTGLSSTIFTHYGIDGQPTYYRPKYSEYRQATSQMNGQYYPTSDFYPRWPNNWLTGTSAWRGWQWIVDSRYNEINLGDKLYSPFVSPGWSLNEEDNIRPAQWLGLLKILGVTGAEFYYTGFFNEAASYNPPNPPPANPANYAWQVLMPSYSQAITSRYENLLRNSNLLNGDKTNNYQGGVLPGYSYNAGDVRFLVSARKHTTLNKYVIGGTVQPNSNQIGNAELEKDAAITLATGVPLQFKIRRQGSVYIYDATVPASPVFYQLDGWHENKHPYYWSKDFALEAELYDNSTAINGIIKTSVPAGTAVGDYRVFTSYLGWNDTTVNFTPVQYNFQPRVNNQTYYLWVRAKSKNGVSTGVIAQLDATAAKTISCITDTSWNWYRYDICQQQISKFVGVTNANHLLKITAMNSSVQFDKILLTLDSTMVLNAAVPSCFVNTTTITASGPTAFCTGDSVVLSTSSGSSYLWSTGATTQSIKVFTSGSYVVTVNYVSGCAALATPVVVTASAIPTATISTSGPTTFCSGSSVTLTASAGTSYHWSNGATTQSIVATASGSYQVTVTNGTSCSKVSSPINVVANPLPNNSITASDPTTFCVGNFVILSVQPGYNYLWTNGATTNTITVNSTGTFHCQITSAQGCSVISANIPVTVNPLPANTVTANGSLTFCQGNNVALTATSGASFLWSNGITTQSATINTAGSYLVTVTSAQGCTSQSAPQIVSVNSSPDTVMSVNGSTTFCSGGSVTLSLAPGYNYLWNNGATTNSITALSSGSYSCLLSTNQGCTKSSSVISIVANSNPVANVSANGALSFCTGNSVILTATGGTSYLWSCGQTTPSINVTSTGNYFVTVTNSFGCTASSSVQSISVSPLPPNTISVFSGTTTFCSGGNVVLTAPAGYSYLWSDGSTDQMVTAFSTGVYSAVISSGNGCTSSTNSISVTSNATPSKVVTSSGPLAFCNGGNVTLYATPSAQGYLWSTGATTSSINITNASVVTVTVTSASGCSAVSDPITITENQNPVANIYNSGSNNICAGDSIQLSADPGASYLWSTGSTTQNITVKTPGSYYVRVAIGNGCSSTSTTVNIQVNQLPTAAITPATGLTFCQGDSVLLQGNSNASYLWSNGSTTQNIYVNDANTYQLTVTNQYGCSMQSSNVLTQVNQLPVAQITANGLLSFCTGGSVQISGNAASGYLWNTSETSSTITATASGNYSVMVTDANGCKANSNSLAVTVFPLPSNHVAISGPITFCAGGSVTLTADSSWAFYWSNGLTNQSAVITQAGSYSVIIENGNGCTAVSETVNVNVLPAPNASITATGNTTFCQNQNVILGANYGTAYLWSSGETTQQITTGLESTFYVTVTDSNGCSAQSAAIATTIHPLPVAHIAATGATTFCSGSSVTLISDSTNYYQWNNGSITNSTLITSSGNYYVIVTDENGCTASSNAISVTVNSNPTPVISAGGPLTFCAGNAVTISSTPSLNYIWSNGETNSSVTINTTGNYHVIATDINGCSGQSSDLTVTANPNPIAQISANGPLTFCTGNSVVLSSTSAISYLWNNGNTNQTINATVDGNYNVTLTDINGCTAQSNTLVVTTNATPVAAITANGPLSFCVGGTVTLTSGVADAYLWNTGQTTQSINVNTGGNYFVVASNLNGCTAQSNTIAVTVYSNQSAAVTPSGPLTFCSGGNVVLTCDPATTYLWSNGLTTQSITVTTPGTYYVIAANAGGCSAQSLNFTTVVNANPVASIVAAGPTSFCAGGSVKLTAGLATTYLWSNGKTTRAITPTIAGNYVVTVSNASGCTASASQSVVLYAVPVPIITASGSLNICPGSNVKLTANSGSIYLWSNGQTLKTITVTTASTFTVTVTNSDGCSAVAPVVTTALLTAPSVTVTPVGPTSFCAGGSVILDAGLATTYLWSNGQSLQTITAVNTGTYKVTVTNANGCSAISSGTIVTVNPLPAAAITASGSVTFCNGDSVIFSATTGSGLTYVWKKNGVNINGATGASYTAKTAGAYKCLITNSFGCTKLSNVFTVTINCRMSNTTVNSYELFPNPTADAVYLKSENGFDQPLDLAVYDVMGRKINLDFTLTDDNTLLMQTQNLAVGTYIIMIKSNDEIIQKKLVVAR